MMRKNRQMAFLKSWLSKKENNKHKNAKNYHKFEREMKDIKTKSLIMWLVDTCHREETITTCLEIKETKEAIDRDKDKRVDWLIRDSKETKSWKSKEKIRTGLDQEIIRAVRSMIRVQKTGKKAEGLSRKRKAEKDRMNQIQTQIEKDQDRNHLQNNKKGLRKRKQ
jgi:hypothetical protein